MAEWPGEMIVRVEGLAEIQAMVHNLRMERIKFDVLINRLDKIIELEGKRA